MNLIDKIYWVVKEPVFETDPLEDILFESTIKQLCLYSVGFHLMGTKPYFTFYKKIVGIYENKEEAESHAKKLLREK